MKNNCMMMIIVLVGLLINACEQTTESIPVVNPFLGEWIEVKFESETNVSLTGEIYTRQFIFNDVADNTFNAQIYSINTESVTRFKNETGLVTALNPSGSEYVTTDYNYTIQNDTLVFEPDSLINSSTRLFMLNDDTMLVKTHLSGSNWFTYDHYLIRYEDQLPPESWKRAIANDNFEPNDNYFKNATPLSVGHETSFHTISNNDVDWFSFDGEQGKTYEIRVIGHMDNEIWLYTYDNWTLSGPIARDFIDSHYIADGLTNVTAIIVWKAEKFEQFRFFIRGWYHNEGYYKVHITETGKVPPIYEGKMPKTQPMLN